MTKIQRILVAGGDARQIYCERHLSRRFDTGLTGFENGHMEGVYDCLILPCIPIDENGSVPSETGGIPVQKLRESLAPGALIIAGRITPELRQYFPDNTIRDYLTREEFQLSNAVPTAEGAVETALRELPVTLSGSRVLIVGLGRIGTSLAGILKGFGADVTAAVRSAESAAKSRLLGVRPICMEEIGGDCDVVFNTVPCTVLKTTQFEKFPRKTIFIELASPPYGIDLEAAEKGGFRVIKASGLPGKTAPVTAGRIIANTAEYIISEEVNYE